LPAGKGLLGALIYFGLQHIDMGEKTEMRALAMRGGPYTVEERLALLAYCMTDVIALERLLPVMLPLIDFDRALLRSWYSGEAVSAMEFTGVPIDIETWRLYQGRWTDIQAALIAEVDAKYGVYVEGSFDSERFADFLARNEIPWSRTATGKLELKDDVFDDMSQAYPILKPLRQLRQCLSGMRLHGLTVGRDGRNRTQLWPFSSTTGRNQPSNAEFIFGPGAWMRGLIRAPEGHAVAYLDLSAAEFGIAAKLSDDPVMLADYAFDPYLGLGRR
jgi:DNA polymerase I-like protein with 3'-5' exonuclease and polymerase domains